MRTVKTGLLLLSVSALLANGTAAWGEDGVMEEVAVSSADSTCTGGWCLAVQGKGTGIVQGGNLRAAFACTAHVAPSGSNVSTVPAATQVTECYMKTGNSQSPSVGRTLPGNSSAVGAQFDLANYMNPTQICVAAKVIFENNTEVRVPSAGVTCSTV